MKRKVILSIVFFLSLLLIGASIMYCLHSEKAALLFCGIDIHSKTREIEHAGTIDKVSLRMLQCKTKDGDLAIVSIKQNIWGLWTVSDITTATAEGSVETSWQKQVGTQRFTASDVPRFVYEHHYVYCANNATSMIQIPAEAIPSNVSINVSQDGVLYILHVVAFGEPDLSLSYVVSLLQEQNYLP